MDASLKAVVGKFQSWMVDAFGGSGDPQLPDAVEICPSVELSKVSQKWTPADQVDLLFGPRRPLPGTLRGQLGSPHNHLQERHAQSGAS